MNTTPREIDFQEIASNNLGVLSVLEQPALPFLVKRIYFIRSVPDTQTKRGFHAHKTLQQVAVATSGTCRISLFDGKDRMDFYSTSPSAGLYIPPGWWREMTEFSKDCVLSVFASDPYDETDYIRDLEEYTRWKSKKI